ncbi:hypothetical protein HHI36_014164 [Cryptolaemus montrouzieri]|uniref:Uncharacterized protein n=1 Tax=Cryptolaemus montrouzieri TaxID=559131 RepID=A0ABD2N1Q9_9CUCU
MDPVDEVFIPDYPVPTLTGLLLIVPNTVKTGDISDKVVALETGLNSIDVGDSKHDNDIPEIVDRVAKAHNLIISNLPENIDEDDKTSASTMVDHSSQFWSVALDCLRRNGLQTPQK